MIVYQQPHYYEVAFSFIKAKEQVDNFETIITKFSEIEVKRFLDIACGPSLQLREIARRGYESIGLDSSSQMLRYLEKKAKEEGVKVETVKADMTNFKLKEAVDFAFIMMGSLNVESNEKFLSHLDSVAASLNKGGLYFIQNQVFDWTRTTKQSWTIERNGITVKTTFEWTFTDILNQIFREKITLEVNDNGKRKEFVHKEDFKFIFPQEFKALIRLNGKFEFLGWWQGNSNTWYLDKPLDKVENPSNNMILLRRN
jgi:ubiquinone/menaquinone biosynthesis C-methylase UbiE